MDDELQQVFNLMVSRGINLFDTADSYGAAHGVARRISITAQYCVHVN